MAQAEPARPKRPERKERFETPSHLPVKAVYTPEDIPDPFNIFQNSPTSASGTLALLAPVTKPGDRIVFRALLSLVGAVSACPQDFLPVNGFKITDLRIRVSDASPC